MSVTGHAEVRRASGGAQRVFEWLLLLYAAVLLAGWRLDRLPGVAVAAALGGLLLYFLARRELPTVDAVCTRRVVVALAVCQAVGWAVVIVVKYFSVSYAIMDTGWFAHVAWNIATGRGFANDIMGQPQWVDHFVPNLALIAPLFRLWTSFLWLPFLRLAAWLACLPILWAISARLLADVRLRWLVLLLWLVNFTWFRVLSFEFHPSSLAPPFVLLAFLLLLQGRPVFAMAALVFVLGFKEHMALAWVSAGVWLAVERGQRRGGVALAIAGVAAGLAIVFVITPALSGGVTSEHLAKFGPLSMPGPKLVWLVKLLIPLGLLPLALPRSMLYVLPACAVSLVSQEPEMLEVNYHYQDLPITVLFVAVIASLQALESGRAWPVRGSVRRAVVTGFVAGASVLFANARFPAYEARKHWPTEHDRRVVAEIEELRGSLQETGTIWALESLGVYLFDHPGVRRLHAVDQPFDDEGHRLVVVADGVNDWPLGDRYGELRRRLDQGVADGVFEVQEEFEALRVYEGR